MRVGVLSDTHLRSPNAALDHILEDLLAETDMILHAGDIVGRAVLDRLEAGGVLAVCGNMDDYEIAGSIPNVRDLSVAGKRIVLIHGWGSRHGLEQRILARFADDPPDLIVYGHSHVPFWGKVDGVHMFNPGSSNPMSRGASAGIMEIVGDKMEGRFIPIDR
jgi:putative phosphoesterase